MLSFPIWASQGRNETPKFFLFPQILVATNVRELKFGTMLTPARFYAHWKEKDADQVAYDAEVSAVINKPVKPETVNQIAADLIRTSYVQTPDRAVTTQDRGIYSLLRPERLLDLTRNFILYDGGIKKIARYPQYFAIKKALRRLKTFDEYGRRRGGLIWHTQGTGKSLTMVMLVKCLIDDPDIVLPRVLVVTDRRDLDKQISDTFTACNIKKDVKRTTSAKELLRLIKEKDQRVITSLIHKFEAGKANIELNFVLPKACQIGFTGTPLMKREKTSERIETIALDILEHYREFIDTGLKAQVVAPSKYAAVMFVKAFNLQDKVPIEVIISESADKEEDDKLPEHKRLVVEWLANEKHKHGTSLETREKNLIKEFKENPEGVRILIVVDKLLTGFDAPRNAFLYLAKQLKDHNLLQAIARVNRLFDGDEGREAKVNGFVIDYSKNAKNLYDAMELFSNYDPEDIERALLNSGEKIHELERVYQELHSIFNAVANKQDTEEYVRILEDDVETRERFYELVNEFIKQFSTCRMLYDFTQKFDAGKLHRFQGDLKKFVELKKIQKIKNAEEVDFSKYEDQIRRILDKYVSAEYVVELSKPLCIAESTAFNEYIENTERGLSAKSKAEAIAAQTRRTIKENFHRDPEFYRRFSEKIQDLIKELKNARKEDLKALLERAREYQDQVHDYEDSDIPDSIKERKEFHPFFRNLQSELKAHSVPSDLLCEMVKAMHDLIEKRKIVDWDHNIEVERRVRIEIEDYLFDVVKKEYGIPLEAGEIDAVVTLVWNLAVENKERSCSRQKTS